MSQERYRRLAQAVTDALNLPASPLAGQATAERAYYVPTEPQTLGKELHVYVVPLVSESQGGTRDGVEYDVEIGVAVVRQILKTDLAAQDAFVDTAEAVADFLTRRDFDAAIKSEYLKTQHDPVLDREHLYESGLAISQIRLTHRTEA